MKVLTFLGTRPEIIKLSRVIPELDHNFEHVLVNLYQNSAATLNRDIFKDLGVREPNAYRVPVMGAVGPRSVADIIAYADATLDAHQPDAVLVLGDTDSAMAAYAAKRRQIPVFHMEAGNRCFDDRTPEEVNRRLVDHMSDVNLVYTEHARRNLLAEGFPADRIIRTGSPMVEVLAAYEQQINASSVLEQHDLKPKGYYVVSAHRAENVDDALWLWELQQAANHLAMKNRVIWSVHPRTAARLPKTTMHERVTMHEPFGFFDYMKLQQNALCTISDSGTLTEEAAIAQFPAVMLRRSHERPEGMDAGTTIMSGPYVEELSAAVHMAVWHTRFNDEPFSRPADYNNTPVGAKVARIIRSYTPFIRSMVYR